MRQDCRPGWRGIRALATQGTPDLAPCTPAGAAFAAVRARSGSAPAAAAAAGNFTSVHAGGSGAGVSSGGDEIAGTRQARGCARRGSAASDRVDRGGGGGGGAIAAASSAGPGPASAGGRGRAATASAVSGRGGGGGGGDVSGLPGEQQVVHYARAGAAAAAGGDAVKAAMAFHLLNGCFMRAKGGYEGAIALAAATSSAEPGLPAALVGMVSEGAPQSLVAYNTLSYLTLSAEVINNTALEYRTWLCEIYKLLSAGLVSVLVGQLRAAANSTLEQQLLVSGLGLLVTMARVSTDARSRLVGLRGVALALAAALGHAAAAVRAPALQLVQLAGADIHTEGEGCAGLGWAGEMGFTRTRLGLDLFGSYTGLDQVLNCAALLAALDRLSGGGPQMDPADQQAGAGKTEEPTPGSSQQKTQHQELQRQARRRDDAHNGGP
ncbi:hypothetical protein VOLCADRAFT_106001 [Volvox carteri f. nagariensis]|uniref:Uncharacterized protein n=1 Tax=Volvox carteri f. nagariensis TaxID=3068 RepID=D8U472_VOLCA|nr:uncharacterized protein VOLCADRAFT_106001 [Volvox carteri f. nagariensis]EFJ45540.1 hypothetical protein VOLCADRAFT_106001 [Volvox carteri f. nagariensis]|eukprot:XP_002953567.1 hypothetical protein VOLCADRAFT_106001 [Volvox carteri f. nagariensis]